MNPYRYTTRVFKQQIRRWLFMDLTFWVGTLCKFLDGILDLGGKEWCEEHGANKKRKF